MLIRNTQQAIAGKPLVGELVQCVFDFRGTPRLFVVLPDGKFTAWDAKHCIVDDVARANEKQTLEKAKEETNAKILRDKERAEETLKAAEEAAKVAKARAEKVLEAQRANAVETPSIPADTDTGSGSGSEETPVSAQSESVDDGFTVPAPVTSKARREPRQQNPIVAPNVEVMKE